MLVRGARGCAGSENFLWMRNVTHHFMLLIRLPSATLPESRVSLGRMMSLSTVTLLIVTGVLIIFLALLILFNENYNATKGYKLRTLERERSQLLLAEEILKMRIAEAQSLATFQNDPLILSMVEVKGAEYIRGDTAVAQMKKEPLKNHRMKQAE